MTPVLRRISFLFRRGRGPGRRAGTALLLGALALAGTGPLLHACPHHDAVLTASAEADSDARAHAGARFHGDAGHATAGPAHDGEEHEGDHGPCTCIGLCHGSSLTPVAALAWTASRALEAPRGAAVLPAPGTTIPAPAPPYLLPYPNGPPGRA